MRKLNHFTHYPNLKKITAGELFKNKALYQAFGVFLGGQIPLLMLSLGAEHTKYETLFGILSILLALFLLLISGLLIKNRKHPDAPFRVFPLIVTFIIMTIMTMTILLTYGAIVGTPPTQQNQQILIDILKKYPLIVGFLVVIATPVFEELTFRELLPRAFGSSHLGFLIAAIIFVASHTPSGILGWISYGSLTAAFLYTRLRYDNLYMCIILHILWNAFSVGIMFV